MPVSFYADTWHQVYPPQSASFFIPACISPSPQSLFSILNVSASVSTFVFDLSIHYVASSLKVPHAGPTVPCTKLTRLFALDSNHILDFLYHTLLFLHRQSCLVLSTVPLPVGVVAYFAANYELPNIRPRLSTPESWPL